MLLSHSQPRKRHSSKSSASGLPARERRPAWNASRSTRSWSQPRWTSQPTTVALDSSQMLCSSLRFVKTLRSNRSTECMLSSNCHHPGQRQAGRFESSSKAANINVPCENEVFSSESSTAISHCLQCSSSSYCRHTQPQWFGHQLRTHGLDFSCDHDTSRRCRSSWPKSCVHCSRYGCF